MLWLLTLSIRANSGNAAGKDIGAIKNHTDDSIMSLKWLELAKGFCMIRRISSATLCPNRYIAPIGSRCSKWECRIVNVGRDE